MSDVDLAIYVGALDYFWEWQWLPEEPMPPAPEGIEITVLNVVDENDRQARQKKIKEWRNRMTVELSEWISTPLQWDETDRRHAVATPGGKCWTALMLWTTFAELSETPPVVVGSDATNSQAFARLEQSLTTLRFRQIVQCIDYWLPVSFDTVLKSTGPVGDVAFIGSSPVLLAQLEVLNAETWKADRATIEQWSEAGEPADGMLESQARYAFAELLLAAQYSCENQMPMKYYFDIDSLSSDSDA
jgi:hypothetical protein